MKLTLTVFARSLPIVFLSREGIRTFCHEQVKSIFSFFNALVLADWSISTSWLLHLGTFQHPLCSNLERVNYPIAMSVSASSLLSLGAFQLPDCAILCVCVCVCGGGGGGGG